MTLLAAAVVIRRAAVHPGTLLTLVAPYGHVLAAAAVGVDLLARAARVAATARGLGIRLAMGTSLRAQLAGDALAAVTPSRVGSDPAKLAVFLGAGVGVGSGGALLLAEMASEALVLSLAAAGIAALVPGSGWWIALGAGGYAVVVTLVGGAAVAAAAWPTPAPPAIWSVLRLGSARWQALRGAAADFRAHARALARLPGRWMVLTLGAAVLHIGARLTVLPALVLAGAGIRLEATSPADLVLRPFFVLYATALLPPPGGGGGVEVAFATVLGAALPGAVVAATLVWWRWYTFYLSALLGWLSLGVWRLGLHKMSDTGLSPDLSPSFSAPSEGP